MSLAERLLGIFSIVKTEAADHPRGGGSKSLTEGLSALTCGSHLENRILVVPTFPTHLRGGFTDLLSSYTLPQLACFAAVVAPAAALSLGQRLALAAMGAPVDALSLARAASLARGLWGRVPAPLTQWAVEVAVSLPGPSTPHWPTWGWLGAYASSSRRPDAGRPTHLASELEVFWTGRGGSFALSFLALSLSARILLVIVLFGIL